MRLEFLGVRGEIESKLPNYEFHSGILVDDSLLLDFGEMSFLYRRPKWILLSHLHPDHAAFITHPPLPPNTPPMYGPEANPSGEVMVAIQPFTLGPYHITPVPTQHSHRVRSQGYRIDDGASSLLYTGDILGINETSKPLLIHLDAVVTDASFMKRGGLIRRDPETDAPFGHTGIPDLVKLFSPFTKRIILTHYGEWFYQDPQKAIAKITKFGTDNLEVIPAREGLILEI